MDDAKWWGLGTTVFLGILAWFGRRFESAGSRAVTAQGAAAQEWQELAVFQRERAEAAEELAQQVQAELAQAKVAHAAEVAGLEQRLEEAGLPVRRRPRIPGAPVYERDTAP